jgi:hypothetical protein
MRGSGEASLNSRGAFYGSGRIVRSRNGSGCGLQAMRRTQNQDDRSPRSQTAHRVVAFGQDRRSPGGRNVTTDGLRIGRSKSGTIQVGDRTRFRDRPPLTSRADGELPWIVMISLNWRLAAAWLKRRQSPLPCRHSAAIVLASIESLTARAPYVLRCDLVFGRAVLDPGHEAAFRFGGKAPRGSAILIAASKPWLYSAHCHPGSCR